MVALLGTLTSLLLPARCVGCGLRGELLCPSCDRDVPWLPYPLCPGCGQIGRHIADRNECSGTSAHLADVLVACAFEGPVRKAVHALKYRGARNHAALLADLVVRARALDLGGIDLLVPVPLSRNRQRVRGFNQAELIARAVARRLDVPFASEAVLRSRDTMSQVGLDGDQRRANVAGAFLCPDAALVSGRHVVLLDDVTTTGATFRACAEPLADAGAASVTGLAVAKEL